MTFEESQKFVDLVKLWRSKSKQPADLTKTWCSTSAHKEKCVVFKNCATALEEVLNALRMTQETQQSQPRRLL